MSHTNARGLGEYDSLFARAGQLASTLRHLFTSGHGFCSPPANTPKVRRTSAHVPDSTSLDLMQ